MTDIRNLNDVTGVLEELGYDVKEGDNAVHVAVGGSEKPFVAVLTIDQSDQLMITCKVAKLGDLREEEIPQVQFYLLDTNSRIMPFAFAIITASDDAEMEDAADYPIVLLDSMPLGDLSSHELASAMDSLLVAVDASGEALKLGL